MGQVDDGVTPQRHLDHALRIERRVVIGHVVMPEAHGPCIVHADLAHLRHFFERTRNLIGIPYLQGHLDPALGLEPPLGQPLHLQARFNGKKAQAMRNLRVVAQLGGAHGGAPRTGRHDAPAVVGKEDGVDQLGLAARELGHEGHHDAVGTQLPFEPLQTFLDGGIHEIVRRHPLAQLLELPGEFAPPDAVLLELLVEGGSHFAPDGLWIGCHE